MVYEYVIQFIKSRYKEIILVGLSSMILAFVYIALSIPVFESKISVIQEDYGHEELQGKGNQTIGFNIFSNTSVNSDYEEAKLFSKSREFLLLIAEDEYFKDYFFGKTEPLKNSMFYQSEEVFLALKVLNETLTISKNPVNDVWLFSVRSHDQKIVSDLGLTAVNILNKNLSKKKIERKKFFITSLENKLESTKETTIKIYLSNTLAKLYEDVAKIEIQTYPLFRPIETIKPGKRKVWPRPTVVILISLILSFAVYFLQLVFLDLIRNKNKN